MVPREFFPTMPDEVFDMWIAPFIVRIGWPFTTLDDNIELAPEWKYKLVRIPLAKWATGTWRLGKINGIANPFEAFQSLMLDQIISHCVHGKYTLGASSENAKERFDACASFIEANGFVPKPIACVAQYGVLKILDGNHRAAAFCHVKGGNFKGLSCWVFQPDSHG